MKILIMLFSFAMLSACHHHYQPLESSKKAKLVNELIISAPQCLPLKKRLLSPSMDDDSIDDVYHQAIRAQCINKDV